MLSLFILLTTVVFASAAEDLSSVGPQLPANYATIDAFEQRLIADKSKRIAAFQKYQSAMLKEDYKTALEAAKPLESNAQFLDYYHYLVGLAEVGRMKKAAATSKFANAILSGESAIFHFNQVDVSNPYTTLQKRSTIQVGEIEIALAELYLKTKKRPKGLHYFERGFQRLGQANLMAVVPKKSIISYAILCEKAPNDMCTSWVSRLAPLAGKSEEARVVEKIAAMKKPYIEKSSTIPYRVDLDLQAFQTGFTAYLAGKHEDAYATWRDLLKNYPRTTVKLRTKFWMARAAQKTKHDAQAETLFREVIRELPFSYYALLSSWYGNIDLSRALDAELPLATSETPMLTPADVIRIRRAETLIASGVPEYAHFELQEVRPNSNMPNEFLVYLTLLNHLSGNHLASFQVIGELSARNFRGLFSSYGQKLYFPTAHMPLIRSIAKEWKADPLLVISIIKQESAFNSDATSIANALGLMQIIPPTARDLDPKLEISDLFRPSYNVNLGTKYIQQMLKRYNGSIISALAAYNAGPGNSDRWLRDALPNLAPEEFIELITFKETREYVQSILRNFYWYNRRIRGENIPSLSALTQYISPMKTTRVSSTKNRIPAARPLSSKR